MFHLLGYISLRNFAFLPLRKIFYYQFLAKFFAEFRKEKSVNYLVLE